MSDYGHNATPPLHLLPPVEEYNRLATHLEDTPGLNLFDIDKARLLQPNGVHVSSFIRPGFSGLVMIAPYKTGTYVPTTGGDGRGELTIKNYGRWCMVYENARHQQNINPSDRSGPDFAPFSLDDTEIIRLRNNGRLLVQKTVARIGRDNDIAPVEPSYWNGVIRLERTVPRQDVKQLMTLLAIGMALEERDAETFAKQPSRKIVPLMSPLAYLKYSSFGRKR